MSEDPIQLLRRADPLQPGAVDTWVRSDASSQLLEAIFDERTAPAYPIELARSPRRFPALVAAAVAALLMVAGGIAGAAVLLGRPAPEQVKKDVGAAASSLPNEVRLNPDVTDARSVATSGSSTMYVADLRNGGHCIEIVDSRGTGGSMCTSGGEADSTPIDITVPFVTGSASTLTVGGRVNEATAAELVIRYADGSEDPIRFGDDHYFLFEVPASKVDLARSSGFELIARDGSGTQVAMGEVPPDVVAAPGEEKAEEGSGG
jgi:hypothetical protein